MLKKVIATLGIVLALMSAFTDIFGEISFWLGLVGLGLSAVGNVIDRYAGNLGVTVTGVVFAAATAIAPGLLSVNERWGRIGILVGAVVAAVGKGIFGTDVTTPPSNPTAKFVSLLLITCLAFFAAGARGCNQQAKPSEIARAAKAFAIAPVAMRAAGDIGEILDEADELSEPAVQAIYHATDDAQTVLDQIQADIEAKKFDEKRTAILLKNLNTTVNATIQSGLAGIKNPQTKRQVQEWSALFSFAIDQILATLEALKPAQPDTPTVLAQSRKTQSAQEFEQQVWSPDVISRVVAVSTRAAIEWAAIQQESDPPALWRIAKIKSQLLHEANKERLK